MTIAINSAAKKRKGSVLLQTLVMCIVLASIAVSLTRWILARYMSTTNLRDDSELTAMGFDADGYEYSHQSIENFNSFVSYSYGSYALYGGFEPGPCGEGSGAKSWQTSSSLVNSTGKVYKVTHYLGLPRDVSESVNACLCSLGMGTNCGT